MRPEEKAKELTSKYIGLLPAFLRGDAPKIYRKQAKNCALIAVEEIISQWEYIDTYLANGQGELNPNLKYWHEVKQHLIEL